MQDEEELVCAALDGDADAACELGRLWCNEPQSMQPQVAYGAAGEAERWLRLALKHRPDFAVAAALLAALLDRRRQLYGESLLPPWWNHREDADEKARDQARQRWAAELGHQRDEAVHWYRHALRVDPSNGAAASGLVALFAGDWDGYGWSRVSYDPVAEDDHDSQARLVEFVTAVEYAVTVNPADNLAAFAFGMALELRGAPAAAVWYQRAVDLDPDDWQAAARLQALAPSHTPPTRTSTPDRYSFYLLEASQLAHASGDTNREIWISTDAGEIKTAADRRLANGLILRGSNDEDDQDDFLRARTYQRGKLSAEINLTAATDHSTTLRAAQAGHPPTTDWSTTSLPPLHEKPLPVGHPVRIAGRTCYYGYNLFPA
jgi:tetratricopeptide (TPR) repeat protein